MASAHSPVRRLLTLTLTQPRLVLACVAAFTVLMFAGLVDWGKLDWRLGVDASVTPLLPSADRVQEVYDYSRQAFGSEDRVIVALASNNALAPESRALLGRLHQRLRQLPGVQQVDSLHNAALARDLGDGTEVWPVAEWLDRFQVDPEALLAELRLDPGFRRSLIADDGRVAGLILTLRDNVQGKPLESALADAIVTTADELVAAAAVPGARVWVGGPPIVSARTVAAIIGDLKLMLPAILGIFAVLLAFAFRSVRALVLPLVTISLGLIWTLGAMAWLGHELNLMTVIVPPLIMTLGLAYSIHIFAPYYVLAEQASRSPQELVGATLIEVARPLLLTALTTIVGFVALAASPLPAVRHFAWFSALGVALTMLAALTLVPAVLVQAGLPRHLRRTDVLMPLFEFLSRLIVRRRITILVLSALVGLMSVLAATQIRVGSNFIADFPADSRLRQDHDAIGLALGGANPFNIIIRADINDAFAQADTLRSVAQLQTWLDAQPEIGTTLSVVDALRQIDLAFGGRRDEFVFPEATSTIKQMFALGGGAQLSQLVDTRLRVTNIIVRATPQDSFALGELVERIEQRLTTLPRPLQAHVTGTPVVIARTLQRIGEGQVLTLGIAMFAIFLILAVVLTSVRSALLALLPNLLPISIYYGALGLTGVPLSPTTGLIACIVLGVAVDDTIHYLVRFNSEARRLRSETQATATALREVLRPVTLTTIALVLGFLVLTHSELRNQAQFGALAAFTLAMAWLSDVSFTPALAARMRIVTLWDLLLFDLGARPQDAIPLFHGLNLLQARTFALMAQETSCAPGETLFSQGDSGADIYVVIEGRLSVSVEQDGQARQINELHRGEVIGEVGFFLDEQRSATIRAVTAARLLQFTAADLDRITRRRPLLGARIFRNLNRIQAQRMVKLSNSLA